MDEVRGPRRKLLWLIGLRVAVVTILVAVAGLAPVRDIPLAVPLHPFLGLAAVTYVLTLAYLVLLPAFLERRWLVGAQIGMDVLVVSVVVFVTGGIASDFSTLYVLPVLAASVIQLRRGGLVVAVLSAALYAGIVSAQYTGAAGLVGRSELVLDVLPRAELALLAVGINASGFAAVAWLTGYLAENLQRAGEHLEEASSRIADLQALSQHVIDSLTGGLATADASGRVLTFNRAAERILGIAAAAACGRLAWEVLQIPEEQRHAAVPGEPDGRGRRTEYLFTHPGGGRIVLGLTAAPLVAAAGTGGSIFSFQDLTEAKRHEREAQMQKRLAAVGEMAAGIAHEIRNPLASMSGSIQILRQELSLTTDQAQLMDIVLRESQRLDDIIRSFLAYARPRPVVPNRFDVERLLRETVTLLRNSPEFGEGHAIDAEVPAGLTFEADEAQVRQIVWNLATNGLRAMPGGGRLRLAAHRHGIARKAGLLFSVSDEGVGIPIDDLDRLFQPFRSTFDKGTGLGLAIVHRITSDHGGDVSVSSVPGRGTEVRVFLPDRGTVTETMPTADGHETPESDAA